MNDVVDAALSGPMFLALYAVLAIVTIVVVSRAAAGTSAGPAPLVDAARDPFEVAYLRGGANELVRFALFDLVRRQALRVVEGKPRTPEAFRATGFDPGDGPAELDAAILAFCDQDRTVREIFGSEVPRVAAALAERTYRPALERDGLLASTAARDADGGRLFFGIAFLVAVAGARLAYALAAGHRNVVFLIFEAMFAVYLLAILGRPRRISASGRRYLERVRAALRPGTAGGTGAAGPAAVAGAALPIFVAASGMAALANTPYAPMNRMFSRAGSDGGCGGGGDSGGSSCSSGGGCGGGCGG